MTLLIPCKKPTFSNKHECNQKLCCIKKHRAGNSL